MIFFGGGGGVGGMKGVGETDIDRRTNEQPQTNLPLHFRRSCGHNKSRGGWSGGALVLG